MLSDESEPELDLAVLRKANVEAAEVRDPSFALLVIPLRAPVA